MEVICCIQLALYSTIQVSFLFPDYRMNQLTKVVKGSNSEHT